MVMARRMIASGESRATGERRLDCIRALYPLKERFTDRFRLNVNTVVCAENYTEIEMLSEYLWDNFRA